MNRNKLLQHIDLWKSKLGSYKKVADRCDINVGALSTILANKYGANEAKMLQKIAVALDYKEKDWNLDRSIGNYQTIKRVCDDAQNESMWMIISDEAGSCKTATLEDIYNNDMTGTVTYIQCQEWSARNFLLKLIEKTVGIMDGTTAYNTTGKGYKSITDLVEVVANYFNDMSLNMPLLLIDEADKLRPGALRTLIPLFNKTEDKLGLVLSGTENLAKEVKQGVRTNKKGYDEIESRCGRSYVQMPGGTKKEVLSICAINGVDSFEIQEDIWNNLPKKSKSVLVKTATGAKKNVMIDFVDDFRRIKRLIKLAKLKGKRAA